MMMNRSLTAKRRLLVSRLDKLHQQGQVLDHIHVLLAHQTSSVDIPGQLQKAESTILPSWCVVLHQRPSDSMMQAGSTNNTFKVNFSLQLRTSTT